MSKEEKRYKNETSKVLSDLRNVFHMVSAVSTCAFLVTWIGGMGPAANVIESNPILWWSVLIIICSVICYKFEDLVKRLIDESTFSIVNGTDGRMKYGLLVILLPMTMIGIGTSFIGAEAATWKAADKTGLVSSAKFKKELDEATTGALHVMSSGVTEYRENRKKKRGEIIKEHDKEVKRMKTDSLPTYSIQAKETAFIAKRDAFDLETESGEKSRLAKYRSSLDLRADDNREALRGVVKENETFSGRISGLSRFLGIVASAAIALSIICALLIQWATGGNTPPTLPKNQRIPMRMPVFARKTQVPANNPPGRGGDVDQLILRLQALKAIEETEVSNGREAGPAAINAKKGQYGVIHELEKLGYSCDLNQQESEWVVKENQI